MNAQPMQVFKLHFDGPLHIADVRLDYGTTEKVFHSDALAAALLAVQAKWGETLPEDGKLPVIFSSLFPFIQSGTATKYFFPKPLVQLKVSDREGLPKQLKKIQWVDQAFFERILSQENLGDILPFLEGNYLADPRVELDLMTLQTIPRVQVARTEGENPNIYYVQTIRFRENAGLYFLASGSDEGLIWLERALQRLGEEGIGTDRNVGFGHFTSSQDSLTLRTPESANALVNLGLYCPKDEPEWRALKLDQANTDLIKRGGWITSENGLGIRKQSLYFFREGSIFKLPAEYPDRPIVLGNPAVNLSPATLPPDRTLDHPVWRSGTTIFLPIKLDP